MKIDPTKVWWLIIVLLPLVSVGACILSESFQGEGYMEAWHDSDKVTDRTTAQGRYDYAAEVYPGGVSSGLNISNGTASYSFQSGDYSIRLKKFSGEIVAEADSNGTIIDLSGSGKMSAISYPTRPYASSVRPFPIGGLKGDGKLFLHVTTEFENIPIDMWNGTEWANTPVNNPPAAPSTPSGSTSGDSGSSYTYSTRTTDPDGDRVKYTFDWGDGSTSVTSLVSSGSAASTSHTWTVPSGSTRTFSVRSRATDEKGLDSDWSRPLSVTITGPAPVNQTPVINQTTNETETIDSINDTTWIDGSDWDDTTVIFI